MKKIILGIVVIAIAVFAAYIVFDKRSQSPAEKIKIGVLAILSGDGAAWGESAKKGIDLALEEWKIAHPEREIEFIFENTAGEAKQAVTAYQKLVTVDKVDAIIGPLWQIEIAAVAPLIEKNSVPVVSPSYAPVSSRPNPRNPLLVWMDATAEAQRMADYVYGEGVRKVAAIGTEDSWEAEVTNAFAERFRNLGGVVSYQDLVQADASDVKSTITRALASKPDAVYIGTYYQFINSVKALRDLKFNGKRYGIEVDSYLAGETKGISDGLEFIAPEFYSSQFIDKFESKYKAKPGIPAGQAYDATMLLLSFMEKDASDQPILEQMKDITAYDGVSGAIQFTADNRTFLPTAIFVLKNGEIERIK